MSKECPFEIRDTILKVGKIKAWLEIIAVKKSAYSVTL